MNKTIKIRRAQLSDLNTLVAFNTAIAIETEGITLAPELITKGVENLLNNSHYGFYLIAEIDEVIAGSLMITTEWSDWRNGLLWWVQSVYVKEQFRRKGVYRSMYEYVKELASKEPNVCGFRLYVERDNIIAQKTYESLGMKETKYKLYEELKK